MQKWIVYIKQPYEEKGVIKATLDMVLRALTLGVWGYLVYVLGMLLVDALVHNYSMVQKMWWFSYCFIVGLGGTWLAYILLFVRDYYGADEE